MLPFKNKELLFTFLSLTVHRPDIKEARICAAGILLICVVMGLKTQSPIAWALIGVICIVSATFDLIPPENPMRTLSIGLAAGAAIGFVATL